MTSWRKSTDPDFDATELHALVLLRTLPALSDKRLSKLLSETTPRNIIDQASPASLGETAWRALDSVPVRGRVERAMQMIEKLAVTVLTIGQADYPPELYHLGDFAPPVLFCRGRHDLFDTRRIALIGARDSTEYGDAVAEMFATDLARRGVTIVSGLARGIDSIGHGSALAAGAGTIAVLGCGIDVDYPPRNARLQRRIAEAGLLISEFAPGEPALPHHFPQRNRLIAMLSAAVLVIEAGPRSGTRLTVDWALEHGCTVFAVPGPIGRHASQGTNEIIQQGAHLVVCARDIFETLHWSAPPAATVEETAPAEIADPAARAVFAFLEATALHIDEIARRCGRSSIETLGLLTQLELDGVVRQHSGKRFARVIRQPRPQPARPRGN